MPKKSSWKPGQGGTDGGLGAGREFDDDGLGEWEPPAKGKKAPTWSIDSWRDDGRETIAPELDHPKHSGAKGSDGGRFSISSIIGLIVIFAILAGLGYYTYLESPFSPTAGARSAPTIHWRG